MDRRDTRPSLVTPLEAESLHQNQGVGRRDHLHWEKEEELCQHLESSMDRAVQLTQCWLKAGVKQGCHMGMDGQLLLLSHENSQSKFFMNYSDSNYALF